MNAGDVTTLSVADVTFWRFSLPLSLAHFLLYMDVVFIIIYWTTQNVFCAGAVIQSQIIDKAKTWHIDGDVVFALCLRLSRKSVIRCLGNSACECWPLSRNIVVITVTANRVLIISKARLQTLTRKSLLLAQRCLPRTASGWQIRNTGHPSPEGPQVPGILNALLQRRW